MFGNPRTCTHEPNTLTGIPPEDAEPSISLDVLTVTLSSPLSVAFRLPFLAVSAYVTCQQSSSQI